MLVGIDGNEANVAKRVGVGSYGYELLWQFEKYSREAGSRSARQNSKFVIYLKENARDELPKINEWWNYRVIGPKPLWTQIALPFDLFTRRPRPDVFFTPTHYAPRFSPVPTVVTILDLSYIHFPHMFKQGDLYKLENWSRYSVAHAAKVLTISKASKDDIIKTYGVSGEKIVVTYPGIKRKSLASQRLASTLARSGQIANRKSTMGSKRVIEEKFNINGDYILFVGTLQPRKNIVRLVEAFSYVILRAKPEGSSSHKDSSPSAQNDNLSLVIVGKKGWQYEEILSAPKKYKVEERVRFLDFVSDEDLGILYQHARCFVLPSLYEGFGLPVLEAMQYGCPVVTSNVSSLPEAGGDASLYVNPDNVEDIAETITRVICDERLRQSMIEKGYEQVKKFSWEKTARQTLEALEKVAEKNV